ncbi:MAG: aldehyde dehydrogenase family protein, partial [Thermoanaerobaculia bacterium]
MFRAVNPATEELIREYPEHDEQEVGQRLKAAGEAFQSWRRFGFAERAAHLSSVADRLREDTDGLARMIT